VVVASQLDHSPMRSLRENSAHLEVVPLSYPYLQIPYKNARDAPTTTFASAPKYDELDFVRPLQSHDGAERHCGALTSMATFKGRYANLVHTRNVRIHFA
jgi:hypothetical protein